jgi:hypothetical protein
MFFKEANVIDSPEKIGSKWYQTVNELLQSEKDYINDLEIIKKVFMIPILQWQWTHEEERCRFVHQVFSNIEAICVIHKDLYEELIGVTHDSERLVLSNSLKRAFQQMEIYKTYCANMVTVSKLLDDYVAQYPTLKELINELEQVPVCRRLPMKSFLDRPRSRIAHYGLFMNSLLKYSAEDQQHELEEAKILLNRVLCNIDSESGKASRRVQMRKVLDKLILDEKRVGLKDLIRQEEEVFLIDHAKTTLLNDTLSPLVIILLKHFILFARPTSAIKNIDELPTLIFEEVSSSETDMFQSKES